MSFNDICTIFNGYCESSRVINVGIGGFTVNFHVDLPLLLGYITYKSDPKVPDGGRVVSFQFHRMP